MSTTHGRLSASRATQFINCPASPAISERHKRIDAPDEFRDQGTKAHSIAQYVLTNDVELESAPGFEDLEADEVESLLIYTDFCKGLLRSPHAIAGSIEDSIALGGMPDVTGIVDFWCLHDNPSGSQLWVVDYKHGAGEYVSAFQNEQLLQYALLICLERLNTAPVVISLVVIQPRYYATDEAYQPFIWDVDYPTITDYLNRVIGAVNAVQRKDVIEITTGLTAADTNPGDHCRWCAARGYCPGLYRETVLALAGDSMPLIDFAPPANLTPAHLVYALELEDRIKAWLKEVRSFVMAELQRGSTDYPGYKLVESMGNRRYKDPTEAANLLELTFGDEVYTKELLSPAQLEKRFKKRAKAILQELTERPVTGSSLVKVDNDKPALEFPSADQEFEPVTE